MDALKDVDLVFPPGTHTAVVGPSGSGKSTLLNLVGALDVPTSGSVIVDGEDISSADRYERAEFRRQRLGFVFQSFHLLPDRSVVENVELALLCRYRGRRRTDRSRARDVLRVVGLDRRWDAMPRHLSGGEQQRVAVARALSTEPQVLLMDEPTGNLDSASAELVLNAVSQAVHAGLTVITVTHDHDTSAFADGIVKLSDGGVER